MPDKAMKFILKSNIFFIKLEMSAFTKYLWSSLVEECPSLVLKFHKSPFICPFPVLTREADES